MREVTMRVALGGMAGGLLVVAAGPPAALEARDCPAGGPAAGPADTIHVVESCNTLSRIAEEYYGDPAAWEVIFEANRDELDDPDDIRVGQRLVIPLEDEGDREEAPVDEPDPEPDPDPAEPAAEPEPAEEAAIDRRRAHRSRPFEQMSPGTFQGETRTVFYYQETDYRPEPEVVAAGEQPWAEVPPGAHAGAPWLDPDGRHPEHAGTVYGFVGDPDARRVAVHPHDRVRVLTDPGNDVGAGDRLLAYRVEPVPPRTLVRAGTVEDGDGIPDPVQVRPTGVLEVERVEGGGVVARVTGEFRPMRLFDGVAPHRESSTERGIHPVEVAPESALTGRLVGFEEERQVVQRGDRGYIDLGAEDGVRPGDVFIAMEDEGEEWGAETMARLQVLRVEEETASVRVDELHAALREGGLPVRRIRRMP